MRRTQKGRALRRGFVAGSIVAMTLVSAHQSVGLTARPPIGAIRISTITIRSAGGVVCAYRNGSWTVGARVDRKWFVSFRQLATNYTNQARKSRGAARANLERLAGSNALKALNQQSRCSRLKPPVTSTPSENVSTLPVTPSTNAVATSTSPNFPESSTNSSTSTSTTINPDTLVFPDSCSTEVEKAWEVRSGVGAGELVQALACGEVRPVVASGAAIKVGVISLEGSPAADFPEYYTGLEASIAYVNTKLGGVGANLSNGRAGRPIELVKCAVDAINFSSHTTCANALVAANVDIVLSTLTLTDNYRTVLASAGIKEIVGLPLKSSDFLSSPVRSLGSGGCTSLQAAMTDFVARELGASTFSLVMADTPPGVFCYDVGTLAASDVLSGQAQGSSSRRGSLPSFQQTGVKLRPGKADVSTEVATLIGSNAQVYGLAAQGQDCVTVLNELIRRGWSAARTKLVASMDCYDAVNFAALGSSVDGLYLVGAQRLTQAEEQVGLLGKQYEILQKYLDLYVADPTLRAKKFINDGFLLGMRLWQASNIAVLNQPFSGSNLFATIDALVDHAAFGGGRIDCAQAPYSSACDTSQRAYRYTNGRLVPLGGVFSGLDLLAGTTAYVGSPSDRRILNP